LGFLGYEEVLKVSIDSNIEKGPRPRLFFATGSSRVVLGRSDDPMKLKLRRLCVVKGENVQPLHEAHWFGFDELLKQDMYGPKKISNKNYGTGPYQDA
jgi:hypothetical protein